MLDRIGSLYAYVLGWPALRKLHYGIFYLSARALGLGNYASERVSGENTAMRIALAGKSNPIVFDVGANEGRWLSAILAKCPAAQVHAFEPQPALASKLVIAHPDVQVSAMGLGDEIGSMELFDYSGHPGSQHATFLQGVIDKVHGGNARSQRVPIGTIDGYCAERRIDHIDFLKIDAEGFDLHVLRGARRMLQEHRVDVVQFEFTHLNLVTRTFMQDFAALLPSPFQLFRVLPHGLLRLEPGHGWENEQFAYQNVLAIRNRQGS